MASIDRQHEADLIRRAKAGDDSAASELLQMHHGFITNRAMLWNLGLPHADAMQEARIGFLKAIKGFDPALGFRLTTYAGRAIRFALRTPVASSRRWASRNITSPAMLYDAEVGDSDFADDRDDIHAKLRGLSPQHRRVLRMRFGIGCRRLTLDEVGKKIGLTKERVRQIQNRALGILRSQMAV